MRNTTADSYHQFPIYSSNIVPSFSPLSSHRDAEINHRVRPPQVVVRHAIPFSFHVVRCSASSGPLYITFAGRDRPLSPRQKSVPRRFTSLTRACARHLDTYDLSRQLKPGQMGPSAGRGGRNTSSASDCNAANGKTVNKSFL